MKGYDILDTLLLKEVKAVACSGKVDKEGFRGSVLGPQARAFLLACSEIPVLVLIWEGWSHGDDRDDVFLTFFLVFQLASSASSKRVGWRAHHQVMDASCILTYST
jgi:hypothetical protein